MAYIEQDHDWVDGEQVTVTRLNRNVFTITNGLSDGIKDINLETVRINGTPRIDSSGNYTGDITGDITGTISSISTHLATGLSDITNAGSGSIITGTERTNFGTSYTDTNTATDVGTGNTIVKRALDPENGYGLINANYITSKSTLVAFARLRLDLTPDVLDDGGEAYNIPQTIDDADAVVWDGVNKWWKVKTELPGGANFDTDLYTVVFYTDYLGEPNTGDGVWATETVFKYVVFSNSTPDNYIYIKGITMDIVTGSLVYATYDSPFFNSLHMISIYEN